MAGQWTKQPPHTLLEEETAALDDGADHKRLLLQLPPWNPAGEACRSTSYATLERKNAAAPEPLHRS